MSKEQAKHYGGKFEERTGASLTTPTRARNVLVPAADKVWLDEHDRDTSDPDRNALGAVLVGVMEKNLTPFEQEVLLTFVYDQRGTSLDTEQGKDSGIRATARAMSPNPLTGKPRDKNTVKRALDRAQEKMIRGIEALPQWQQQVVGRSLTDGALPDSPEVIDLPSMPSSFPERLRRWLGE